MAAPRQEVKLSLGSQPAQATPAGHALPYRRLDPFAALTSEAVAVPSTSGTPPPVPAPRPKRQAEISPVASASSSGNTNPNPNPPPVPAPRPAKRMTVAAVVKPLGGAASTSSGNTNPNPNPRESLPSWFQQHLRNVEHLRNKKN